MDTLPLRVSEVFNPCALEQLRLRFPLLTDELKIVNLNYVVGIDDGAMYTLTWLKGSSLVHAPDKTVADAVMDEWVKGINHYFQSEKLPYTAKYSSPRNIRMGTYSGKQYAITADAYMAGYARIISRRVGDQHEGFALAVSVVQATSPHSTF